MRQIALSLSLAGLAFVMTAIWGGPLLRILRHYKIGKIIYSDAYASEMVAYADLILPDTTYLERFDCISLLDRPISEPNGPADAIRHPVVLPDRDVPLGVLAPDDEIVLSRQGSGYHAERRRRQGGGAGRSAPG